MLLFSLNRCSILQASMFAVSVSNPKILVKKCWSVLQVFSMFVTSSVAVFERDKCLFESSRIRFFLMSGLSEVERLPLDIFNLLATSLNLAYPCSLCTSCKAIK